MLFNENMRSTTGQKKSILCRMGLAFRGELFVMRYTECELNDIETKRETKPKAKYSVCLKNRMLTFDNMLNPVLELMFQCKMYFEWSDGCSRDDILVYWGHEHRFNK